MIYSIQSSVLFFAKLTVDNLNTTTLTTPAWQQVNDRNYFITTMFKNSILPIESSCEPAHILELDLNFASKCNIVPACQSSIHQSLKVLQGPTWMLRCWSPAWLGKMCLCIIGSLWTGDHHFISCFPSCSYMETSSLGRKLLSSSESTPCELYCSTVILSSYLTHSNLSYNHLSLERNPLPDIRSLELILTALLKALASGKWQNHRDVLLSY